MSPSTEELIQQAIEAAKGGDRATAQIILAQALRQEPKNARAWYLASQVVESNEHKINCLNRVLEIQPDNQQAINRLSSIENSIKVLNAQTIPEKETPVNESPQKLSYDGDQTKKCPYCAEIIKAEAPVCRFCGRDLIEKASRDTKPKPEIKSRILPLIGLIVIVCIMSFTVITLLGKGNKNKSSNTSSYNELEAIKYIQDWKPKDNRGFTCKESYDSIVYFYRNGLGISDARVEWNATKQNNQTYFVFARLKGETGWANYRWELSIPDMTISTSDSLPICQP